MDFDASDDAKFFAPVIANVRRQPGGRGFRHGQLRGVDAAIQQVGHGPGAFTDKSHRRPVGFHEEIRVGHGRHRELVFVGCLGHQLIAFARNRQQPAGAQPVRAQEWFPGRRIRLHSSGRPGGGRRRRRRGNTEIKVGDLQGQTRRVHVACIRQDGSGKPLSRHPDCVAAVPGPTAAMRDGCHSLMPAQRYAEGIINLLAAVQFSRLLHQLDGRPASHARGLKVEQPSAHVFGRDEK